jgi:hypothetical protein
MMIFLAGGEENDYDDCANGNGKASEKIRRRPVKRSQK